VRYVAGMEDIRKRLGYLSDNVKEADILGDLGLNLEDNIRVDII
jgi:hypothetical protein